MLAKGEELPVEFKGRVIYYVGPVDPVRDEVVGPATTATRMDKFMDMMLDQGLLACVGKAARGHAVDRQPQVGLSDGRGGAAYLVARAIKESKVVGFADLGMEAIYEFTVEDMPVTVAVDSEGQNVHQIAPLVWKKKIADEGLLSA
jgi:fumarate hydratase class I